MITALNGHISATVPDRLIETPCRGFLPTQGLFINPSHAFVTEASIEGYRGLYVADVDTDIRHAHDLGLIPRPRRFGYGALLQLQIDAIGVAHEDEAVTRGAIGLTQKLNPLLF